MSEYELYDVWMLSPSGDLSRMLWRTKRVEFWGEDDGKRELRERLGVHKPETSTILSIEPSHLYVDLIDDQIGPA